MQMIETEVEVIEVGPHAWCDEPAPRCKSGDVVMVAKYSGWQAGESADGQVYRMVNDRDIFAQVVGPRGEQ